MLGLPEKDESDSNKVAAAVRRWLGREPGYLLILDNADDPALVKPYLPPDPKGHVLLTSRAHNFDVLGIRKPIGLPVLTPDEALEFLLKRTGREGPLDPAEQDAARTLADELGYLPLALEQAAAYMVEHEEAFSVYLAAYRTLRLKLLDEMGPVAGEYPETVRTTWKRSFDAVAAASPASIALLRLSAFFAPDAIPYELILEGASELGEPLASALASPPGGDHALNKLLTPLARHSLVRRDPEARTYSVHRLVQAVLLDELTAATRKDLAERAVKALNRAFPDVEYANWPRCERLVPHALAARGWIESEDLRVPEAARLLNQAGYYLYLRARYAEAEPLLPPGAGDPRGGAGPRPPRHGPRASTTWRCCSGPRAGHAEAEPLLRRALAIREEALGPDHPDTATSLNNLAVLLQAQGRYAEAEPLLPPGAGDPREGAGPRPPRHGHQPQRPGGAAPGPGPVRGGGAAATAGRWRSARQALGPDHPDTATSLNNLAEFSGPRAGTRRRSRCYRRALAIREQALGPDHPDTATSLNNLAVLLRAQGRYAEAEPLYRRALAIREKALGPDHPDTAASLNNLAVLLRTRAGTGRRSRCTAGRWRSARRAWAPTTPTRPTSLNNLAVLLQAQGRYAEAEPLYRRALAIREQALGPDHPDTATSLNNLALLLQDPGPVRGGGAAVPPGAGDPRGVLGPDHPDTATSLNNLAALLQRPGPVRGGGAAVPPGAGDPRGGAGPGPPRHGPEPQQPGGALRDQGRYAEAEPLYRRALAICEQALGPDHPDTAHEPQQPGGVLQRPGPVREAEPLFRRALAIREQALGPDHPDTATSLNNLAALLRAQGRYARRSRCTAGPGDPRARRWAPTTPTRPRASTTWRCSTTPGPIRGGGAAVPPGAGDPRAGAGPRPPRHGPEPQQPGGVASGPGPVREAEPLYRRALAIREGRWAPTTPTRPPASTTWRRCSATRAGTARRSRCSAGRWRSASGAGPRPPRHGPKPQQPGGVAPGPGPVRGGGAAVPPGAGDPRAALGPDHPDTAQASTTWRRCSGTRAGTGRRSRCTAGRWRSASGAGPRPPRHGHQPQQPGELLRAQGRSEEAEPLSAGLAIREAALGPDHPHTATSRNDLERLLWTRWDKDWGGKGDTSGPATK